MRRDSVWDAYHQQRTPGKALLTDTYRFKNHLQERFGDLEPHEIDALQIDKLKADLAGKLKPQTISHILGLLKWIINFGKKRGLTGGLTFQIEMPKFDNRVTEDLTPAQLKRLLKVIAEDDHPQAGPMMKMVLATGMRKTELFKLTWDDCDFERGFIHIRDPKGVISQKIPLNASARAILEAHTRYQGSPFVFPGKSGGERKNINKFTRAICTSAGLPKTFRPLHGLRHFFASHIASSGEVDLYTLQRLLTHKDPRMTQRYAHLRDEALKKASDVAGSIFEENGP